MGLKTDRRFNWVLNTPVGAHLPSRIRPAHQPRGPHFGIIFFTSIFGPTDTKNFLRARSAPIYTKLKESALHKKKDFLVNIFQKKPKNRILAFFSEKMSAAQET